MSLSGLRGKVVVLTNLDPVGVSDCPLIARDFRIADGLLGVDELKVEMVSIDSNPEYLATTYLQAFDRQENLEHLPNWDFLTGSPEQLKAVLKDYGETATYAPAGAMINHSEFAYVIDPSGVSRFILDTDPWEGTKAIQSSLAVSLAGAIKSALLLR